VSKKGVKESACGVLWVVIIIDLYKGRAASFRCYSIFSIQFGVAVLLRPLKWNQLTLFHNLSLLSTLVLVVGLNSQFSPYLKFSFHPGDYSQA
jgi:hypothetical protein